MKLVLFGTSEFAVPLLERAADSVVLAVSQPDRASGRGMKLHPSPLRKRALELGIPTLAPEKCRDPEFIDHIGSLAPDYLLTAAYGQIMPTSLLEKGRQGAFNLHGSLLPKLRGAAPIQRAIMEGLEETGVTLMQMARRMDAGDMIAKVKTPIGPDETYGQLHERLAVMAADLYEEWKDRLAFSDYPREVQNEEDVTFASKIERDELEIRFEESAREAFRRIRGLTPPGSFLQTRAGRIKLLEVGLASPEFLQGNAAPGIVVSISPECIISFRDGALVLKLVQPEGRRAVSGRDWLNGSRLKPGDSLNPLIS